MRALKVIWLLTIAMLTIVGVVSLLTPDSGRVLQRNWRVADMPQSDQVMPHSVVLKYLQTAERLAGVSPGFLAPPEIHVYDQILFSPNRVWAGLMAVPSLGNDGYIVKDSLLMLFVTEVDPPDVVGRVIVGNLLLNMCPAMAIVDSTFEIRHPSCMKWVDELMIREYGTNAFPGEAKVVDPRLRVKGQYIGYRTSSSTRS